MASKIAYAEKCEARKKIDIASRVYEPIFVFVLMVFFVFFYVVFCIPLTMTKIAIMLNQKCAQTENRVRNK